MQTRQVCEPQSHDSKLLSALSCKTHSRCFYSYTNVREVNPVGVSVRPPEQKGYAFLAWWCMGEANSKQFDIIDVITRVCFTNSHNCSGQKNLLLPIPTSQLMLLPETETESTPLLRERFPPKSPRNVQIRFLTDIANTGRCKWHILIRPRCYDYVSQETLRREENPQLIKPVVLLLSVSYCGFQSHICIWLLLFCLLSCPSFAPIGLMDRRGIEHFLVGQWWVFRVARFNIIENELINDDRHYWDRTIMSRTGGRSGGGEQEGGEVGGGGELRLDDYYLAR